MSVLREQQLHPDAEGERVMSPLALLHIQIQQIQSVHAAVGRQGQKAETRGLMWDGDMTNAGK